MEIHRDAENRLIKATVGAIDVTYDYDYLSRLIKRDDGTTITYYLYDGWNRIAEYTGTTLKKTYTWGMDLSGTIQGAGGVGGLVCIRDQSSGSRYYPNFDGNGNVSEYVTTSGGSPVQAAHFEYDPFGNLTTDTGGHAAEFPFRFSSKPQDPVTGLYYYGYRYYDPLTGRWPSRDPIGERGGVNLYGFVGNNALSKHDILGMSYIDGFLWDTELKCEKFADVDLAGVDFDFVYTSHDKDIPISEALREFWDHLGLKVMTVSGWASAKGSFEVQCRKRCTCQGRVEVDIVLASKTYPVDVTRFITIPLVVSPTWTLKVIKLAVNGATVAPYLEDAIEIKTKADEFCSIFFE